MSGELMMNAFSGFDPMKSSFSYWTTKRAPEAIGNRSAFGLNWDPSH